MRCVRGSNSRRRRRKHCSNLLGEPDAECAVRYGDRGRAACAEGGGQPCYLLKLPSSIWCWARPSRLAVLHSRTRRHGAVTSTVQTAGACLFWPLFVPMLLSPATAKANVSSELSWSGDVQQRDSLAAAISQVEAELDAALDGLDGWAEDVLNSEQHRLEELRIAWKAQADRIRQIDQLLAKPSARVDSLAEVAAEVASARQSEKTRQDNIRQLSALRNRMHADLVGTLAWVRELVTMIHLAKFSGAPAARAEELVAQIAAAVQGLSEVSRVERGTGRSRLGSRSQVISTSSTRRARLPCDAKNPSR